MREDDLEILRPAIQAMISEEVDRGLSSLGPVHPAMTLGEIRRSEALRAASRIVSGAVTENIPLFSEGKKTDPMTATLNAADHFVRWLETGKR